MLLYYDLPIHSLMEGADIVKSACVIKSETESFFIFKSLTGKFFPYDIMSNCIRILPDNYVSFIDVYNLGAEHII